MPLFTTRSELRKVSFLALSVTFLFVYEISREPLCMVPRSDEFECGGQRSKVKVTTDKNGTFRPFQRPVCGLCLVRHL